MEDRIDEHLHQCGEVAGRWACMPADVRASVCVRV